MICIEPNTQVKLISGHRYSFWNIPIFRFSFFKNCSGNCTACPLIFSASSWYLSMSLVFLNLSSSAKESTLSSGQQAKTDLKIWVLVRAMSLILSCKSSLRGSMTSSQGSPKCSMQRCLRRVCANLLFLAGLSLNRHCSLMLSSTTMAISESLVPIKERSLMLAEPMRTISSSTIMSLEWIQRISVWGWFLMFLPCDLREQNSMQSLRLSMSLSCSRMLVPPLEMVKYSQWSWTFMTAAAGSSISPSKPGRRGMKTTTLKRWLCSCAWRMRLMRLLAMRFSTGLEAVALMKNWFSMQMNCLASPMSWMYASWIDISLFTCFVPMLHVDALLSIWHTWLPVLLTVGWICWIMCTSPFPCSSSCQFVSSVCCFLLMQYASSSFLLIKFFIMSTQALSSGRVCCSSLLPPIATDSLLLTASFFLSVWVRCDWKIPARDLYSSISFGCKQSTYTLSYSSEGFDSISDSSCFMKILK